MSGPGVLFIMMDSDAEAYTAKRHLSYLSHSVPLGIASVFSTVT